MTHLSDQRVALVTGASEGIGLAIAHRLRVDGYAVGMLARPSVKLDGAVSGVGPGAFAVACDVADVNAIDASVTQVVDQRGRLDVLVNCGSATRAGDVLEISDDVWVRGFDVKVLGTLRLTRAAWPHLVANQGAVVNIGGIGARTPRNGHAMTGPLSAAVMALTKVFAEKGTAEGVRVNAINPGAVQTPRLLEQLTALAEKEGRTLADYVASMERRDHVTRLGRPEDVAGLVAFLLSNEGDWLQGAIIDMDGGRTKAL